jgi:5-methyltetrahydrofolate--homocysteine methyltransferase
MKSLIEILKEKKLVLKNHHQPIIKKHSLKERDYYLDAYKDDKKLLFGHDEILSMSKPETISEINERYLKSNVDIICTNTTKANRFFLEELKLEELTYELNLSSAKLCRDKSIKYTKIFKEKPRFVAGTLTSLPEYLSDEKLELYYTEQIKALIAGKIDIIYFDKMQNNKSINAAITNLNEIMQKRNKNIDVFLSITEDNCDEWIYNNQKYKEFSNINIIAVGKYFDYNDEHFVEKNRMLIEKSPYFIISPCFSNIFDESDEEKVKNMIKQYFELLDIKVINFDSLISPLSIDDIYHFIK